MVTIDFANMSHEEKLNFFANSNEDDMRKYQEWQKEYLASELKDELDNFRVTEDMEFDEVFSRVFRVQGCCYTHQDERDVFEKIYELIPDKHKLDVLIRNFYTSDKVNVEFLLSHYYKAINGISQDDWKKRHLVIREKLHEYINEDGMVTIYRGSSRSSIPLGIAMSWTLDKNIAMKFATRYPWLLWRAVYTGKICVDDIVYYINDRQEEEVLISSYYNNVHHVFRESVGTKRPRCIFIKG